MSDITPVNMRKRARFTVAAFAAVLVIACTESPRPTAPDAQSLARASEMMPSDPRLAGLYRQSCRTCHVTADSGAPLTGDRAAWEGRWRKGAEALRSSTIRGLNGMPAGGQCFACSPQDYDELIRFMAGRNVAEGAQ